MILHIDSYKRAALKQANKIRAEFGHKPKRKLEKGITGSAYSCPIAKTINEGHAISVGQEILVDGRNFKTSYKTRKFINDFDKGIAYHELRLY